ncbi:uncharacterized protein [Elaeis guineensis]|uniref:Protein FAM133A n=1 Tax=Elaeis guineensis var. tenera TaxID=51953 RepID=A0A6I9QZQ4_ELAGV|nr:protein FAM133A [Elaeis guineensis]
MASLQLKKPILESANCQHDDHTTAQKHQEADAKRGVIVESEKHQTEFCSHGSESLQRGKQTIAAGKTKERGKKEARKELHAATYDGSNMVALKPKKAGNKIKEEKKNEEEKKKSKRKSRDDSSSSSSESEDDVCSKKKGGKEKKNK